MTFRHSCRKRGCYIENQTPDWAFLKGSFARDLILPTDIDGFVETNGYFLTLEWKGINAELTEGQVRAYVPRTVTRNDTVFVLYGDAKLSECYSMRIIYGGVLHKRVPANNEKVRQRCNDWSKWVEKQPTVARTKSKIKTALALLATDHRLDCTGSNDPGQPGSIYE